MKAHKTSNNKIQVQLAQFNNVYGKRIYIPYSVGLLKSYSEQHEEIRNSYEFRPFLSRRDSLESIVRQIGAVDILGLSCYVWNMRLSTTVAEAVKKRNPSCLLVVGGPHVPDNLGDFFDKYPFIDLACHGEGEITFYEILRAHINGGDFKDIMGLSYHDRNTGEVIQNPKRKRIVDLDIIPSPYLSGTFDHLLEDPDNDIEWMGIWESNRGCPFACTFCDWGSAVASKVNRFGMDRLLKEIEWFGKKKVSWVFGADANFGILKRDKVLAEALAKAKEELGYPKEFRVCFTKNSDEKVFGIAKTLDDARMSKGASLSMQSMNPETLEKIKRDNIRLETFHKLQSRYLEEGIATFSEMIIGLPGETYQSFIDGIDTLLDNGQHSQIIIYNLDVMPNAEAGDPEYMKAHGIQVIDLPIFQEHSAPREPHDTIVEYSPIVIATNTMSVDDWRKILHFAVVVQCFHLLGLSQKVAIFLRNQHNVRYRTFYEAIVQFGKENPDSLIGQELRALDDVLDNVLAGIGFDQYLPQFSNITWPPEEAAFLRLSENIDGFYSEFEKFLGQFFMTKRVEIDCSVLDDLMLYQKASVVNYNRNADLVLYLGFNLHEYIGGLIVGKPVPLERGRFIYRVVDNWMLAGDKERFAREVVWFGRKGGKYFYPIEKVSPAGKVTEKAKVF